MISSKYKQFAVIFMLFGLGLFTFGGTPYVSAHGDGIVKRVQLEDPDLPVDKSTEQLGRANPRPQYDRGLPTLDVSADTVGAKGDNMAIASASMPDPVSLASGRKIDYVALAQPVEQVMRELGQAVSLRVVPGPGINGNVRKRHFKGEFAPLMDKLAQEYNLFWFADGGVVYVDGLDDQKTKVIKLKNINREQVYEAMDQAGMGRAKTRVVISSGDGSARVTGPESFQRSIETLLSSLEPADAPDIKIIKYGAKVN